MIKRYEIMKEYYLNRVNINLNKINRLKQQLAHEEPGSNNYVRLTQFIKDNENALLNAESELEFVRVPSKEDNEYREKIIKEFSLVVKELFPDGFPIVFHGTKNIGTVREILKTGGLLTPEQRGVSMTSYANQIDVTYKTDIYTTCLFAESGTNSCLPYGAIFAFCPNKYEMDNVSSTREGEVKGGVEGVSFRDEPDRLYAIISTPENMTRIKSWCDEYGIDSKKVKTVEDFVNTFQTILANKEDNVMEKV